MSFGYQSPHVIIVEAIFSLKTKTMMAHRFVLTPCRQLDRVLRRSLITGDASHVRTPTSLI